MFRDEVTLQMKAGSGGNGAVTFRREKFVPKGGPDGGDGGKGGDIVIEADENYNTLYHLIHRPRYTAKPGGNGSGSKCFGRGGLDLFISVPLGTVVRDVDRKALLKDLSRHGDRVIVCRGGKGGRGNAKFATSTQQTPRNAEPGQRGEERRIRMELKMIADVGLVGLPNAGKSTLLSRLSAARPKVAGYPFTTLVPYLGIVKTGAYETLVMADLPGIIEGAHQGKGLGDKFLRHIERTRVILHLIDVSPEAVKPPLEAYKAVRKELENYSPVLAAKPEVVIATKVDVTGAGKNTAVLKKRAKILEVSAVTGKGLKPLVRELFNVLASGDGIE